MDPAGDRGARRRVIEEHLPLVASIARRYGNGAEPLEDLMQVGAIGLIKAVDRFDPARGSELPAFAAPFIEGEIRHYLRDRSQPVRRPRQVHELDGRVRAQQRLLAAEEGRDPTPAELARAVGSSEAEVADAIASRPAPAVPLGEVRDGAREMSRAEARVLLADGWRVLDERERKVLELRFFRDLTQEQIAGRMGLSQAHVSRLIEGALQRMRERFDGELAADGAPAYSRSSMATFDARPDERPTHSGRLLVRMPQSLHDELARTAEREGVSLNALITSALASAVGWRSGEPAAESDGSEPPTPAPAEAPVRRWSSVVLLANLVVVALAAIAAVVLLVAAFTQG